MAARFPQQVTLKDRPELGGTYSRMFSDYGGQAEGDVVQVNHALSVINHCKEGLGLQYQLEEHLVENGLVSKEKPGLIALEHALLDISTQEGVQGVSYHVLIRFKGKYILRFIESGCYTGFMRTSGKQYLSGKHLKTSESSLLLYQVYNANDIKRRSVQKCTSSEHNAEKRKKGETPESSKGAQRSRHDIQYRRRLRDNKNSVINQLTLFEESYTNRETSEFSVISGIVHVLKSNATPKNQLHRFIRMIKPNPEDITTWNNFFTTHIVSGVVPEDEVDIASSIASTSTPISLEQQFALMSALPNNHWVSYPRLDGRMSTSSCVGYMQHLSYQLIDTSTESDCISDVDLPSPTHLPRSYRNRLSYFVQHGERKNLLSLLKSLLSCGHTELNTCEQISFTEPHPKRSRMYTPRVVKLTPDMLPGGPARTFQPKRPLFSEFKEALITEGVVAWRLKSSLSSIFLLNNYSLQSGYMSRTSFVHLTVTQIEDAFHTKCTCEAYAYLQVCAVNQCPEDEVDEIIIDASKSCMHVRFFMDSLKKYIKVDKLEMLPTDTLLDKKIQESLTTLNSEVVPIGQITESQLALFSVKGTQDEASCSFVTISPDACYMNCKLGSCQARFLNRKKIPRVMDLQSESICDHLKTMQSNSEVWTCLIKDKSQSETSLQESDDNFGTVNRTSEDETTDCFDVQSGLWNFGGISKHKPTPEIDLKLSHCARQRWLISEEVRTKDGFLVGASLQPRRPETCECGAGFDEEESLQADYSTKLYTQNAPVLCQVYKRNCRSSQCQVLYSGEEDCLHQWSKDVCAGDEVGWCFVREVISKKTSFSAFCEGKTSDYRMLNVLSAAFMSKTTFVKWFFSWAAAMKIDFRTESVDPWCSHNPKYLAADGTHVGVTMRKLDMRTTVTKSELDKVVKPVHKRFDRVFLPYQEGLSNENVRDSRIYLRYQCDKILSNIPMSDTLSSEEEKLKSEKLMEVLPDDPRVKEVITHFLERKYPQNLLRGVAYLLKGLSTDAAVSNFVPFCHHENLASSCRTLKEHPTNKKLAISVSDYSPELSKILQDSTSSEHIYEVVDFILYLIEYVTSLHANDPQEEEIDIIPGSYRPDTGIAYYFTEHGCQLRKLPKYDVSGSTKFDDHPSHDNCNKRYPVVSRGGYSYIFLWFCPLHGHCYGFHIIDGGEGRKDPFSSLYKYLPEAPDNIFYDNACGLNEYSLNRAPAYFRSVCMYHDIFHSFSHKCSFCFKSSRISSLNVVNSEICEQFNSYLQSLKYTATHLTQQKFCFFIQFFIHLWNKRKTNLFESKRDIVCAGFE